MNSQDNIFQQSWKLNGDANVWGASETSQQQNRNTIQSDLTPSAPSWSPSSPTNTSSQRMNVPQPSPIKEFVPGKGLQNVAVSSVNSGMQSLNMGNDYQMNQNPMVSGNQTMQNLDSSYMQNPMHYMSTAEAMAQSYGGIQDPQLIDTPRLVSNSCQPLPQRRTLESNMLPDNLRAYYSKLNKLCIDSASPDDPRLKEVPRRFHSILPLDDPNMLRGAAGTSGYPTSIYKVVNSRDGFTYALRRVDNVRVAQENCGAVLQMWQQVKHSTIIPLREIFVQQRALYLVHDFVPGAQSLSQYVVERQGRMLPEKVLWSICTQILTAIRTVHDTGIACRGIHPNRVLLTGRHRVRLSCAGLMHAVEWSSVKSNAEHQQDDLVGLCRVMLMLGCMSLQSLQNMQKSLEYLRSRYSPELVKLILLPFQEKCNVYDLLALASQGLLTEIDSLYSHCDAVEDYLAKTFESDRISRLMIKLGLINERPEGRKNVSDTWSETGDRYIVKLFRDYVFHQTNDLGQPWLDIGHIINCLNKLDIGSDERILLTGRNCRSFLVVTYRDVRRCVEEAFQELLVAANSHQDDNMGRSY